VSMLIAGACCCGSDEPPPPTCAECPKPNLRLFYSYRGESVDAIAGNGVMRIEMDMTSIYQFESLFVGYRLVSFTQTGTHYFSGNCGTTNMTVSVPVSFGNVQNACVITLSPKLMVGNFIGSGLGTRTPDCCEPVVPQYPCSYIIPSGAVTQIEYLTGRPSQLPAQVLIWDGCNAYADDASYQEVVRDEQGKVIRIFSESASWGATVI